MGKASMIRKQKYNFESILWLLCTTGIQIIRRFLLSILSYLYSMQFTCPCPGLWGWSCVAGRVQTPDTGSGGSQGTHTEQLIVVISSFGILFTFFYPPFPVFHSSFLGTKSLVWWGLWIILQLSTCSKSFLWNSSQCSNIFLNTCILSFILFCLGDNVKDRKCYQGQSIKDK